MALVTQVVRNRAKNKQKDPCAIVFEKKQFSWTHQRVRHPPTKSLMALRDTLFTQVPECLSTATHYHTTKVRPIWRKKLVKLGTHNNHVFYTEKHLAVTNCKS